MSDVTQNEVALFNAARRLAGHERTAYLDAACAGNAAMRHRLDELLRVNEAAGDFLEKPAPSDAGALEMLSESVRLSLPMSEKPGDRIGPYKLLQQIGEGGCGVVYMAEQEKPIRRRVALKVIKLGMDTRNVIARFEAERQALALMDHPNIAKVLDAGATETGRPYFVMELVRGIKITDYCDQQRFSTHRRLELFIQVCQAVQHAHQKGIIHRDLKPSNILVKEQDGAPVPKVIDFGIAKATGEQRLTDKTIFTAFEQFIGTPAYMSPEQAGLGGLDVDTRSDIYSLGVLLYELLAGRPPFDSEQLRRSALDEILKTIRETEPPRPSTKLSTLTRLEMTAVAEQRQVEPEKLHGLLRGDLDWIVMKSLEKNRARRYETANGLASDIRRHLNTEPVLARPPSRLYEFQKTVRRHKFGFAATAAIIIVLAAGAALATGQAMRANREAATANRVTGFLQQMLEHANRPNYLVREMLDEFAPAIDAQFSDNPEIAVELHTTLGQSYWSMQEDEKTKRQLARALELCAAAYGTNSANYADSLAAYGGCGTAAPNNAELKQLEGYLHTALAIYHERGIRGRRVIHALFALQMIFDREGRWDELESLVTEAQAEARQSSETNNWELLGMNNGLIRAKNAQGKHAEAETIAHKTIAEETRLFGPDFVETGWAYYRLAEPLRAQSKYAEALAAAQKAVAIMRKRISPDQGWYGDVLAQVLFTLADARSARALTNLCSSAADLDKLEDLFQERLGSKPLAPKHYFDPVNVATRAVLQFPALYLELASELSVAGSTNAAAECRRRALTLSEQLQTQYAGNPDALAQLYLDSLQSAVEQGELDKAKTYREKLLALKPLNASSLNEVAWTLATSADPGMRDGSNAIVFAEQAVAATKRKNPNYLDTLAAAYAKAGQFTNAVSVEKEAIGLLTEKKVIDGYTTRLRLYETNTPCREP